MEQGMKKGQGLICAANLLHGGSKQTNKALTRQSQVTHYYLRGFPMKLLSLV